MTRRAGPPSGSKLDDMKRMHAEFRATGTFATVQEMQEFVSRGGEQFLFETNTSRPISGVISGNCVVLERYHSTTKVSSQTFVVGQDGFVQPIKASDCASPEEAIAFATHPAFSLNLPLYIAAGDTNMFEFPESYVLHLVGGDKSATLYRRHKSFAAAFARWKARGRKVKTARIR